MAAAAVTSHSLLVNVFSYRENLTSVTYSQLCEQDASFRSLANEPLRSLGGGAAKCHWRGTHPYTPSDPAFVAGLELRWPRLKASWGCRPSWREWRHSSGGRAGPSSMSLNDRPPSV